MASSLPTPVSPTPHLDLLPAGSLGLSFGHPPPPIKSLSVPPTHTTTTPPPPMSLDTLGLPTGPSRLLGAATFPPWRDVMEEYFLLSDLWAVVQGTEGEPYASESKWARSVRAGLVEPALPAAESLPRGTSTDTRVRNELLLVQQRAQWLDWRRREHLAQGAILRAVASPEIKERLKTYSRASDMWAHLVATYSASA